MKIFILLLFISIQSCAGQHSKVAEKDIIPGAYSTENYLQLLKNKRVGIVVNQTSVIGDIHLVDSLISLGIKIERIFTPEHGYKGTADAGEKVQNDQSGSVPIISLYGSDRKPKSKDLEGLEVIVFDIQDVGVRFYTYISTLHYVLEAAGENNIPIIVLDRPNPNGFYVDGPVLDMKFQSFVGMHEVPVVYGLTIGEYAQMIIGEGWLANEANTDLTVIPCLNYDHTLSYDLPIKPSPNLPNLRSILLYPSICYFEGTTLSIGRGTTDQFQVIGHPGLEGEFDYTFIPISREGAKYPKHENTPCYGLSLKDRSTDELIESGKIDISYLIGFYKSMDAKNEQFFLDNNFFEKLAGDSSLREQLISGTSESEIRNNWQPKLEGFKSIRKKYLLYPDFD